MNPFHVRGDLKVRTAPLEADRRRRCAPAPRSSPSARPSPPTDAIADLPAIREAARAHGARTYIDCSQAAGWLPVDADAHDYTSAVAFKWLLCPRGVAFFVVPEDLGSLSAVFAGWVAGERPWDSCYGPGGGTRALRTAVRREPQPVLVRRARGTPWSSSRNSAWSRSAPTTSPSPTASARAWPRSATRPCPRRARPIVSVPGLGVRQPELSRAGIEVSDRAGNLRAAFHLYNTESDVDRLLDVLSG